MRTYLLRNALITASITSGVWCEPLHAQWHVGIEVGAARFWGSSRETGGDHASFRPYRPTTFGVSLERQAGRYAIGLQLRYAEASLALEGPELVISSEGGFSFLSISPEVALRVATLGAGNELRFHAGPILEVWDIVDLDARTRLGGQGSVSLDVPLGGRFKGAVLAGLAVTPSPYEEGELNLGGSAPTYDLLAQWRRSFAVGLRYQL